MTQQYFAILTKYGEAEIAEATAQNNTIHIEKMAVGDGGGEDTTPDENQTQLVKENYRSDLNSLKSEAGKNTVIAELIIKENVGGWWVREMGLYDDKGGLVAVANCPASYKPQLEEGSGKVQTLRMVFVVSNSAAVTISASIDIGIASIELVEETMKKHIEDDDPHSKDYYNKKITDKANADLKKDLTAKAKEEGSRGRDEAVNHANEADQAHIEAEDPHSQNYYNKTITDKTNTDLKQDLAATAQSEANRGRDEAINHADEADQAHIAADDPHSKDYYRKGVADKRYPILDNGGIDLAGYLKVRGPVDGVLHQNGAFETYQNRPDIASEFGGANVADQERGSPAPFANFFHNGKLNVAYQGSLQFGMSVGNGTVFGDGTALHIRGYAVGDGGGIFGAWQRLITLDLLNKSNENYYTKGVSDKRYPLLDHGGIDLDGYLKVRGPVDGILHQTGKFETYQNRSDMASEFGAADVDSVDARVPVPFANFAHYGKSGVSYPGSLQLGMGVGGNMNGEDTFIYIRGTSNFNGGKLGQWLKLMTDVDMNYVLPIGIPQAWPLASPPDGWLLVQGQAISPVAFPKLAAVYGANLPDMRAAAIRGLDAGKGVDVNRQLLSLQLDAVQNIVGTVSGPSGTSATGAFGVVPAAGIQGGQSTSIREGTTTFDASRVVRTSHETVMRNVAYNYIMRAA
jgi:Phage tail-collar fibre protein/Phage Tail Collar Domain